MRCVSDLNLNQWTALFAGFNVSHLLLLLLPLPLLLYPLTPLTITAIMNTPQTTPYQRINRSWISLLILISQVWSRSRFPIGPRTDSLPPILTRSVVHTISSLFITDKIRLAFWDLVLQLVLSFSEMIFLFLLFFDIFIFDYKKKYKKLDFPRSNFCIYEVEFDRFKFIVRVFGEKKRRDRWAISCSRLIC